mmetsp:Transcript_49009/g.147616  ORF Transcript_49009/g.147616 Transcript_49009/m.147616 type:complete len:213 (-) Transcript_49009:32-670(-)
MVLSPRVYLVLLTLFMSCRGFRSSFGHRQRTRRHVLLYRAEGDRSGAVDCRNLTVAENPVTAIETYSVQAQKLRDEIKAMEVALERSKQQKLQREQSKVEQWSERLLVNQTFGEGEGSTQILNSVEQVAQILKDKRYSPEQVDRIFRKLTRGIPRERIEQSLVNTPLLALLVEACGELDMLEKEDNTNRRWNGRMERDLRRRLFAMEWPDGA